MKVQAGITQKGTGDNGKCHYANKEPQSAYLATYLKRI